MHHFSSSFYKVFYMFHPDHASRRQQNYHDKYLLCEMIFETNLMQQLWFTNQPLAQRVSGTI